MYVLCYIEGAGRLDRRAVHKTAAPCVNRRESKLFVHSIPSYSVSILFYSILFYSILFYSILSYSILFYSILFYSILFYSILFYSILLYSTTLIFLFIYSSLLSFYRLFSCYWVDSPCKWMALCFDSPHVWCQRCHAIWFIGPFQDDAQIGTNCIESSSPLPSSPFHPTTTNNC